MEANVFWSVGGGEEIGASSYYLQVNQHKILLDAGLRFRSDLVYPAYDALYERHFLDGLWELDAILISHAHLDHIGALPRVAQESGIVPIYATEATRIFMELMLPNTREESILCQNYHRDLVHQAMKKTNTVKYFEPFWPQNKSDLTITFYPAGHILGAAMIFIETQDCNILYTGDFTNFDQFTVMGMDLPDNLKVDVLIAETTYGYAQRELLASVEAERELLLRNITNIIKLGGRILIPAFAVGRAQELAILLIQAIQNGVIEPFPIYMDGLAAEATKIYQHYNINIFGKEVQPAPPAIYHNWDSFSGLVIVSHGMLNSILRKLHRTNRQNSLFMGGYLDEENSDQLWMEQNNQYNEEMASMEKRIAIVAQTGNFKLSTHANHHGILRLITKYYPKKVILVHGVPVNGSVVNIYQQILEQFGHDIEVHHAHNNNPIIF